MKAIVLVFVSAIKLESSVKVESPHIGDEAVDGESAPFWTWFIENPRPIGSSPLPSPGS